MPASVHTKLHKEEAPPPEEQAKKGGKDSVKDLHWWKEYYAEPKHVAEAVTEEEGFRNLKTLADCKSCLSLTVR